MSASDQLSDAVPHQGRGGWLFNQPYVLLSIATFCWAGNAIVGRLASGHIPPVTLTFLRWWLAFLITLPMAWKYLKRDWNVIRASLATMVIISLTGVSLFSSMQYWALEHTTALNTLLLQSAGPLFVAGWSLVLLGVRLTLAQAIGVMVSLTGVLVILLHGDLKAIAAIDFNKGDLIFTVALLIFGLYTVMSSRRPAIHDLSFLAFTFGCGFVVLIPALIAELLWRPVMGLNTSNLLSVMYVAVFPSSIAYLCYNRGVHLIGANRAAPFFHVVPLFGSVMAIVFLGERPQVFHFIGFALVLTGVFVASRKPSAATK
ncbi:DMT family transporter [Bradyrhizobium sp.]|jgi:drug/metabolite transporter (DMT)-like permease|uniref:DMT family transporter n=1 Tax=Bradyrhizobium sp. TaxID=376 RepID=UPI003C64A84E